MPLMNSAQDSNPLKADIIVDVDMCQLASSVPLLPFFIQENQCPNGVPIQVWSSSALPDHFMGHRHTQAPKAAA
ncbi:hypothetical protein OJAV_G00056610 [Oryzias javanicus]|uniref:Uncharacterized protein n=1 Tax=Oryzias javanicus TaxID=123683 RepID=A0A3S2UIU0_ORYJA|nr:hypothetical protein OJAV_G00056610 [Oryzias javanicus]